jgi:DNA-binding response OmpR family regulator
MTVAEASPSRSRSLRALIVEDAPEVAELLETLLTNEGFDVTWAGTGTAAVNAAQELEPDIVVLDTVLADLDGLEVCRQIRSFSDAYVVMVSVRSDEVDRLLGLSIGADDFLAHPFSPNELVARIRAMLRRPRLLTQKVRLLPDGTPVVKVHGDLVIDIDAREVTLAGQPIELTRIEFDLLAVLATNPRTVFSRSRLLEFVWGPNWFGDTHVVDVHVSNLRRKLGDTERAEPFIQTVRGVGFRLIAAVPTNP